VFLVGGAAGLIAALVSTALLLRAGVVTWPHPSARARRPQHAVATATPPLELAAETAG
jgi:hypothetical protein